MILAGSGAFWQQLKDSSDPTRRPSQNTSRNRSNINSNSNSSIVTVDIMMFIVLASFAKGQELLKASRTH